jgi:hypothetical protein
MYKIAHSNKIDGFLCQGMHLKKMMVSMTKNTFPSIKIIKFVAICSSSFLASFLARGFSIRILQFGQWSWTTIQVH